MSKAAFQYIQLIYFYRLLLVRYLVLFNLVSLLAESLQEEEPSLDENPDKGKPRIEPADYFVKERIGQQVTGKELDEETGYYYFGARYYDPQVSMWISTDPALSEYIPRGAQLYFPNKAFNANSLKGSGGIYNSINLNLYQYSNLNPIRFIDPSGKASDDKVKLGQFKDIEVSIDGKIYTVSFNVDFVTGSPRANADHTKILSPAPEFTENGNSSTVILSYTITKRFKNPILQFFNKLFSRKQKGVLRPIQSFSGHNSVGDLKDIAQGLAEQMDKNVLPGGKTSAFSKVVPESREARNERLNTIDQIDSKHENSIKSVEIPAIYIRAKRIHND